MAPGANQFDFPAVEAGEVYRQTIKVTPTAEGVVLLGVTVSLKHDEMIDHGCFRFPSSPSAETNGAEDRNVL